MANHNPVARLDTKTFYQITIRNGEVLKNQEYQQLKVRFATAWGSVCGIFHKMEAITRKHGIKEVHANGMMVASIADDLFKVNYQAIISCFVNKELISRIHKEEKSHFKKNRKIWAGLTILNSLKVSSAKSMLDKVRKYSQIGELKKSKVYFWLTHQIYRMRLNNIIKQKLADVAELNSRLKQQWKDIRSQKRVEIHISNLAYDVSPVHSASAANAQTAPASWPGLPALTSSLPSSNSTSRAGKCPLVSHATRNLLTGVLARDHGAVLDQAEPANFKAISHQGPQRNSLLHPASNLFQTSIQVYIKALAGA